MTDERKVQELTLNTLNTLYNNANTRMDVSLRWFFYFVQARKIGAFGVFGVFSGIFFIYYKDIYKCTQVYSTECTGVFSP